MADRLLQIPRNSREVPAEMAPHLLLGFPVAGFSSVLLSPAVVERHSGGRGFLSILEAQATGIPLPLWSCRVIPAAAHVSGLTGGAAVFLLEGRDRERGNPAEAGGKERLRFGAGSAVGSQKGKNPISPQYSRERSL